MTQGCITRASSERWPCGCRLSTSPFSSKRVIVLSDIIYMLVPYSVRVSCASPYPAQTKQAEMKRHCFAYKAKAVVAVKLASGPGAKLNDDGFGRERRARQCMHAAALLPGR
jgi:hypothetical protein